MGILLCLLLTSNVQSIGLTIPEPSKIPKITEQIQSTASDSDSKCATIMILEGLEKNQKILGFERKSGLATLSLRPTDPGGGIDGNQHLLPKLYNTTRFILHWTDNGSSVDHVPPQDLDGNGIPDIVEGFAEAFEYVWNFEINTTNFPAPPSDEAEPNDARNRNPDERYDVFIYYFGYWGYAYPEQWPDSPSYSYIGVRNSLGNPELRQAVAAHEFFHAIQFVYDCNEETWWMETTATYMEDEVYPSINDNYQYLPKWFQFCDTYGLEYTNGWHEYGNFIFAKRLSEDFGDEIIKEIWEEMVNTNGLVAIENTLLSKNSTLFYEFNKFTTANFFLEDMYTDGTEYRSFITGKTDFDGVWIEYQYNASTAADYVEINQSNVNWNCWMDKWATNYITMKLDPAKPKYRISFDGLDLTTNYLVKLVGKKGGVINETIFNLNEQKDGSLDLLYDNFDNLTLIIANAGSTATTKPSWRVRIITGVHDVAITEIKLSKHIISQNDGLEISVKIENQGDFKEDVEVTIYANDTPIQEQTVILESNASTILCFDWETSGFALGSYKISAYVAPVPGETEVIDNTCTNGEIKIVELFIKGPYYTSFGIEYWIAKLKNRPVRIF